MQKNNLNSSKAPYKKKKVKNNYQIHNIIQKSYLIEHFHSWKQNSCEQAPLCQSSAPLREWGVKLGTMNHLTRIIIFAYEIWRKAGVVDLSLHLLRWWLISPAGLGFNRAWIHLNIITFQVLETYLARQSQKWEYYFLSNINKYSSSFHMSSISYFGPSWN